MEFGYEKCGLCPRMCGTDRRSARGYCGCGEKAVVAKIMLHEWEEPCISTGKGSGAVFFSGCNLRCNYCQNRDISKRITGTPYDADGLAEQFLALQNLGAANINLVTPTPHAPLIFDAVKRARSNGLTLPVVYNTSGYERAEVVELMGEVVDIWLTDFKYASEVYADKYSGARDYRARATEAIDCMVHMTGAPVTGENGAMKRGVIVRHLMLPGLAEDTERVLQIISDRWGDKVLLSLMRQYTPDFAAPDCDLKRRLTTYEYRKAVRRATELGLKGYTQEAGSAVSDYTPDFK